MWIVQLALRRPYTFIVLALLIMLLGAFAILRTPVDVFPAIRIPVVGTIWSYSGLSPEDMANRIVVNAERNAQTVVNDVEHTESQSLHNISVTKYFFQPGVNEDLSYAQITGVSQALLRLAPPGTLPPFVLAYDASTVPILQLALDGSTESESQLFDLANNIVRPGFTSVAGAALPYPYGGKQRQIQVDVDPSAMRSKGVSAADVSAAVGAQNVVLPAGTQKIGNVEYDVMLNSTVAQPQDLNRAPIRTVNGTVVYIGDVANVHDGASPQTNLVRVDGHHSVLLSVLKMGSASTLSVIDSVKGLLGTIQQRLPKDMSLTSLNDQSLFVRAAVNGVIREGAIAAALTALLILLFLGSWRSALIITTSIPLSVLASLAVLSAIGETINIMTLGGLALAVGILVDDATVAVESINWHLEHGKDVRQAILDGAQQIALPALVSTLCICIVFVPMFLLTGVAKFLFAPLAEAVVFAMLASYVLSRTLVPTLANYWLQRHVQADHGDTRGGWAVRLQRGFERGFTRVRDAYRRTLGGAVAHPVPVFIGFMVLIVSAAVLWPWLGRDFFPSVDAGELRLHLRAPSGTRLEQTAILCDQVEAEIRQVIPAQFLGKLVDNIGVPNSGINLAYSTSAPIGPGDADILISLHGDHHEPTAAYVRRLRASLHNDFPGITFSFLPTDIVSQILNFGLPSPLDVQIIGSDVAGNREVANRLLTSLRAIPGAVDMRIQQPNDYPRLTVNVNRTNAALVGLTEQSIASDLLISLAGSQQTAPSFWFDPKIGAQYGVVTQVPQYRMQSLDDLAATPLGRVAGAPASATGSAAGSIAASGGSAGSSSLQLVSNVATIDRGVGPGVVSHYDSRPVLDIYGAVDGTDLGSVADQIRAAVDGQQKALPRGSQLKVRGQVETMRTSFRDLGFGLAGAVILVYLLMVVNFQSWVDPLIIITALPAAAAGMVWMLFVTHTTVSVPALIGAIMGLGVATANSILVISFARERLQAGVSAAQAALEAGFVRFRPVLMTALAMVVGMIPMALGMGEGAEQNAPLGRAVIGGLLLATFATLFLVPIVFSVVHRHTVFHGSDAEAGTTT